MNKTIVPHKNAFVNHFYNFYSHFMKFFLKNVSKDFKKPFFSIVGIYFCNFEKSFIHFSVFSQKSLNIFLLQKSSFIYMHSFGGFKRVSSAPTRTLPHSSLIYYMLYSPPREEISFVANTKQYRTQMVSFRLYIHI